MVLQSKSAASVATLAVTTVRNDAMLSFLTRTAKTSPVDDWSRASMFDQLDEAYLRAAGPAYRGHGVDTAPVRVEEPAIASIATANANRGTAIIAPSSPRRSEWRSQSSARPHR